MRRYQELLESSILWGSLAIVARVLKVYVGPYLGAASIINSVIGKRVLTNAVLHLQQMGDIRDL